MISLIKTIRRTAGKRSSTLILPIFLSCVDSLLHMGMFGTMIFTIIQLMQGTFSSQTLFASFITLLVLFIIRAVFYSINYTQVQYRGAAITADLRLALGNHIRSLNLGYFNKNSIGRLTSTLSTDVADFEQVLTHSLSNFFKIIFFSILALVFAFSINAVYALILLAIILLALPLMGIGGKVAKASGGKTRKAINEVISRVVEYINGIKTFKLYNLTGLKFERLDKSFKHLKKQSIRTELSIAPFTILFSTITSLMIPIALVLGTVMLQNQSLSQQNFIAVIMVAISLSSMMTGLGALYPEINFLTKAADHIIQVMEEQPLPYTREQQDFAHYGIAFSHVDFSYTGKSEVLHDITFEARPGTLTALIGPSGSGKTTIVSLISRFWDVTGGNIRIGGQDIREIAPDSLTKHMAVVFQDVYLLNDTIANNIRVGKPGASDAEIKAAAKAARCHDFIAALPKGYETIIGEGGNTLSGGEKQRISIARALIKNAPIVLLDETTSSLDADNEQEINRALDTLMKGKTVIVIAHRLNTIVNADRILVLDAGEIKEAGTHSELIRQGGWYARMIEEQQRARSWVV